jgi:hypothetical protein
MCHCLTELCYRVSRDGGLAQQHPGLTTQELLLFRKTESGEPGSDTEGNDCGPRPQEGEDSGQESKQAEEEDCSEESEQDGEALREESEQEGEKSREGLAQEGEDPGEEPEQGGQDPSEESRQD